MNPSDDVRSLFRSGSFPVALSILLTACGGGGGDDSNGPSAPMSLTSCTLGCTGPETGPISCSINEIFVNQDLWFEFSNPVDLASVGTSTIQIVETATGIAPAGTYMLDPARPQRVLFRPQLQFDAAGNPSFGFQPGSSYRIRIPGVLQGESGPFVTSSTGNLNLATVDCFVSTAVQPVDVVEGAPTVSAFLDLPSIDGGDAGELDLGGASGVPLDAVIRLEFDDLMNPASVANPTTKTSSTITVSVDLNGVLADAEDRVEIPGSFELLLLEDERRTTVFFFPDGGLPPAGPDPNQPRLITIDLPQQLVDLGGNSISNPGTLAFEPEFFLSDPVVLGDTFADDSAVDSRRTSLALEPDVLVPGDDLEAFLGRVVAGSGAGLGRLGDLRVGQSDRVVLSTGPDLPTVFGPDLETGPVDADGETPEEGEPVVAYHVNARVLDDYALEGQEPGSTNLVVEDGVFDFASLTIEPGGQLEFVGDNPPRLFVRGLADVRGAIALPGGDAPAHDSALGFGGTGGLGAPLAGSGGAGGDRPDTTGTELAESGSIPGMFGFEHEPGVELDPAGQVGTGRGDQPGAGAGGGGMAWPVPLPGPLLTDLGGFQPNAQCASRQAGAPGAGGSFAFLGGRGTYAPAIPGTGDPIPPELAEPGQELLPAPLVDLDPDRGGALLGGAGGGGGGIGILGSISNALSFPVSNPCVDTFGGVPIALSRYVDHSGSGGGGGGGALQIQAGGLARLSGRIDLSGGAGGGPVAGSSGGLIVDTDSRRGSPGGGGSGGALLLQAREVELAAIPGTIDISGGPGGLNDVGDAGMRGGAGSSGVVQLEVEEPDTLNPDLLANGISWFPLEPVEGVGVEDFLDVRAWSFVGQGPGSASGYQSCWLAPDVPKFAVNYLPDDTSAPNPADHVLGWNLKVELTGSLGIVDYRGESSQLAQLAGEDLQGFLGRRIGEAAIVVRFQGARRLGPPIDPCVAVDDEEAGIDPFSLTPWVENPWELNDYWAGVFPDQPGLSTVLRPNLIRAQILLDHDAPGFELIGSILELSIRSQPE